MTPRFEPGSRNQASHSSLAQPQEALIQALGELLDTEAGLREILLHSLHGTAVDALASVLDIEAGLASILPTIAISPTGAGGTHSTVHDHTNPTEKLLGAVSPVDRLAMRNHPEVKTTTGDLYLAQALAHSLNLAHAHALSLDLEKALARDLDRALNLNPDRDIAHGLRLARDLNRNRNFDHVHRLRIARDLNDDRIRDLNRARTRADARGLSPDLARDIAVAHARALDLARVFDLTLGCHSDFHVIVDVRINEVRRAIGLVLRQEPPLTLELHSLHAFLDDFTTADLSMANLAGIDLGGVRWSEHTTQWPPTVEIEELKALSEETPYGSGVWTVQSGTAPIRDLAELC